MLPALALLNHALLVALFPPVVAFFLLSSLGGTLVGVAACLACTWASGGGILDAARATPWVPTPESDVRELLSFVTPKSGFLELGSGDGRNLCLAIQMGFPTAMGVEAAPLLVGISRLRAWWSQNGQRITVTMADALTAPLPEATEVDAIYMYLSHELVAALAPRLACAYGGLHGGPSVLSRDFELPGWGEPRVRRQRGRTALLLYDTAGVERPPDSTCQ